MRGELYLSNLTAEFLYSPKNSNFWVSIWLALLKNGNPHVKLCFAFLS